MKADPLISLLLSPAPVRSAHFLPALVRGYHEVCFSSVNRQQMHADSRPLAPPTPQFSFAHDTMGKRLPTILGKAIDDTVRTLNENSDEDVIKDLVACIERMDTLMHDLSTNQNLRPIIDDEEGDSAFR